MAGYTTNQAMQATGCTLHHIQSWRKRDILNIELEPPEYGKSRHHSLSSVVELALLLNFSEIGYDLKSAQKVIGETLFNIVTGKTQLLILLRERPGEDANPDHQPDFQPYDTDNLDVHNDLIIDALNLSMPSGWVGDEPTQEEMRVIIARSFVVCPVGLITDQVKVNLEKFDNE